MSSATIVSIQRSLEASLGYILCSECQNKEETKDICEATARMIDTMRGHKDVPAALTREMLMSVVLLECTHNEKSTTLLNTVLFLHDWLVVNIDEKRNGLCNTDHPLAVDVHEVFCFLDFTYKTTSFQCLRNLLERIHINPIDIVLLYSATPPRVFPSTLDKYKNVCELLRKEGVSSYEDLGIDLLARMQREVARRSSGHLETIPTFQQFETLLRCTGEKPIKLLLAEASLQRSVLKIEPVEQHTRFVELFAHTTSTLPATFHSYYAQARNTQGNKAVVIKITSTSGYYWQGSLHSFVVAYVDFAKYHIPFIGMSNHKRYVLPEKDLAELRVKYTRLDTAWRNIKPEGFKLWTRYKRARWLRSRGAVHVVC